MSSTPNYEALTLDYVQTLYRREKVRIPFADVTHFQADDKYVMCYHTGGALLLCSALKDVAEVYGDTLLKVHRSTLVVRSRLVSCVTYPKSSNALHAARLRGFDGELAVSRANIKETRAIAKANQQAAAATAPAFRAAAQHSESASMAY